MKIKFAIVAAILFLALGKLYARPTTDTPKAKYDIVKLEIERLKRQRTIQIYLPPGYSTSHKKYPVIYVQDGQTTFIKGAYTMDSWFADSLVNLMPVDKQCIIVAIHAGNGKARTQEYNPYMGLSDGAIYAAYVAKRIKPYIDTSYRTRTDAKYTAVVGSSLGGLITMYIAAKYSNTFGAAGVFSPAFWYAEGVYGDVDRQPINSRSKFFFACGDAEGNEISYVNRMDSILRHKKFGLKNMPAPLLIKGGKHDEKQWRIVFEAFYRWFTEAL